MGPTRSNDGTLMAAAVRAHALLVIEDDAPIRRALRHALSDVADRLLEAATGREGIDLAATERPDLIVLDLGLPDARGVDVCREIRSWSRVPIVVLSARHSDAEKVQLLNAGADDYVTKPFSTPEFVARVRAVLRRARPATGDDGAAVVEAYGLTIDLPRRRVTRGQTVIRLTPIEWDILRTLVSNPGRTLTHQQIFDAVWGAAAGSPQLYLRVHVTNLRRKVEANATRPELIVTEPGVGYRAELPAWRVMALARVWTWVSWSAVFAVATAVLRAYRDSMDASHAVLIYLLVILGGSVGGGRPLGFALTTAGFLSIDFFFQVPYDTMAVGKPLDLFVLLAFLTTAAVTTHLVTEERATAAHAEALREADRLKDGVLASVSHDFRTPLTTIKALAQEGARHGDPNARAIEEEADRLARLVADLLDLSRLKGGALPVQPELNTAEDLVGAAVRQTAGLFQDRTVETKVDFTEPALVGRFDFVQSLRILTNLLGNAVHHTPRASPVELSVQREGAALVFAVADRGPGVPVAERDRIFEPFYRPAGAPADGGGAGLGLAIARRLAELQRGTIEYTPRPGGGSIFTLRLPAETANGVPGAGSV